MTGKYVSDTLIFGGPYSYLTWIDLFSVGFMGNTDEIEQYDLIYRFRKRRKRFVSHYNHHYRLKPVRVLRFIPAEKTVAFQRLSGQWLVVKMGRKIRGRITAESERIFWNSYEYLYPWMKAGNDGSTK